MKNLTCIICPKGCQINVSDDLKEIKGNDCIRGKEYAIKELTNPTRIVTTTVLIDSKEASVVSVKTNKDILKSKIFDVLNECKTIKVKAPVLLGDIVKENIANSGADLIITREILD